MKDFTYIYIYIYYYRIYPVDCSFLNCEYISYWYLWIPKPWTLHRVPKMKVVGFLCYANQLGGSFIFLIFLVFGGGGRLVWVKKNLWEQWEGHLKMVKVKGDTALWMVESSVEPSKKGSPKIKFHDIYNSWAWIDANIWWYLMFDVLESFLAQWQFLKKKTCEVPFTSLSVGKTHAHLLLAAKVIGWSTYPLPKRKNQWFLSALDHALTSLLGGMGLGIWIKLQ